MNTTDNKDWLDLIFEHHEVIDYSHIYHKECDDIGKLKAKINQHIKEEVVKAREQANMDFANQLRAAFIKRSLDSDKVPIGYRKMTDEELIAKVWADVSPPLKELSKGKDKV
jgi:hypothetical protein